MPGPNEEVGQSEDASGSRRCVRERDHSVRELQSWDVPSVLGRKPDRLAGFQGLAFSWREYLQHFAERLEFGRIGALPGNPVAQQAVREHRLLSLGKERLAAMNDTAPDLFLGEEEGLHGTLGHGFA